MSDTAAQKTWQQHVLAHGPLEEIAPDVWQVEGSLPRGAMPRNMVVYRYAPGRLLVHSAIALSEATMRQLESLGTPDVMIVPNRFHRLDAGVYKERYPTMKVICPQAAYKFVQQKIAVDASCEDFLPAIKIKCLNAGGVRPAELVYELPTRDGMVLVVTDLLFNLAHLSGFDGLVLRLLGSTGFFGMTRIGRFFLLKNSKEFRQWLLALAKRSDIKAICVAHGKAIKNQQECSRMLTSASERV